MTAPRADLDELGRLLAEAHDEVVRLCTPGETWRMSIPANPGRDSDLLLSDALTRSTALLAEVAELREAVARVKALAFPLFDAVTKAASPDDWARHLPNCGYSDDGPACGCAEFGGRLLAAIRTTLAAALDGAQ